VGLGIYFLQVTLLQGDAMSAFMSESLNHEFNQFVQNTESGINKCLILWVSHWMIHSPDSLKNTSSFRNETCECCS